MATPVTLNLHLTARCNYRCGFCWATFREVPGALGRSHWIELINRVGASPELFGTHVIDKITFAGGEPTLLPFLPDLIRTAKENGIVTCVVTNSTGITDRFLDRAAPWLDWITFSLDSADERVNREIGRGTGGHVASVLDAAARVRRRGGISIRLNTVVTASNHAEDLSPIVRQISPARWKVLQATPMAGQNDGADALLAVTPAQFAAYVARHEALGPVVESTPSILGSYLMVDPLGRAFGNASGRHIYGEPLLRVGLEASVLQAGWRPEHFEARGGVWDWRAASA